MDKKRFILTFMTGFMMWVVFSALSLLLIYFVPPILRSKLHNEELAQMSYLLIPMAVMVLPFALAMEGTEALNPFLGGSSRIEATVGLFKLMILLFFAFSGIGWIFMGYWTGKSLLRWLEERDMIRISDS